MKLSVCGPAGFAATSRVDSTWLAGETRVNVTVAGAVSVYENVAVSFGATSAGTAVTFCTASAVVPTVPVADRALDDAIVHE